MVFKNLSKIIWPVTIVLILLVSVLVCFFSIRGNWGNPKVEELTTLHWQGNGPFELSPERGRFGLTYSIVENNSLYFSLPIARFILPDLGYKNGHFVSLFAPGVSYIAIPGYLIGKFFGVSQVGTYATASLFGILNLFLIFLIVKKSTGNRVAGLLAGMLFLFATPAFAYAVNLYQHHISTFLILMSLYCLITWDTALSNALIYFLCAMSIPIDYPNLFLMLPIGFTAFLRTFKVDKVKNKIKFSLYPLKLLSVLAVVLPLGFFLWFNKASYDNPFQFSGTVTSVQELDSQGRPITPKTANPEDVNQFLKVEQKRSAFHFFQTRDMLDGLYIHLFSPDRGILIYTPVMLLAFAGMYVLFKNGDKNLSVLVGVAGFCLTLYSMWGDPWGGWAFGSRYLIPLYAMFSILLGVALSKFRRKLIFIIPFLILMIYSIGVNTLGALTTSTVPPKVESLALEKISGKRERYSFDRNWEFLNDRGVKSFAYGVWGHKYMPPVNYYFLISGILVFLTLSTFAGLVFIKENEEKI